MEINIDELIINILNGYLLIIDENKISEPKFQEYLVLLSNKQIIVSKTISELLNKSNPDINSILSLMRLIVEIYLINYSLHFEKISSIEKEYRHLLYRYCGLENRNKYTTKHLKNLEEIKESEVKERNELEKLILETPFFKENFRKPSSKIPVKFMYTADYFKKTDLNDDSFQTYWRLFSNYAHSEYISLIHFIDISDYKEKENIVIKFCFNFLISINIKLKKNLELVFKKENIFHQNIIYEEIFASFEEEFSRII